MGFRSTILFLASFCVGTSAFASNGPENLWKNLDAWSVHVTDTARPVCTARTFWEDGTRLALGFTQESGAPQMIVENPAWRGGKSAGDYSLIVQFGSASPWRIPKTSAQETSDDFQSLRVQARSLDFFEGMMGTLNLNVRYAQSPVQTLSLRGALEAYHELSRCQALVTGTASK